MSRQRKDISTRTRFEVFKRDGFHCCYCGRTPPAVVLHVDHILPVAEGGDNELTNLVTACADCNLGKSDKLLVEKPASLDESLRIEQEKFEQLREYNEWLASRSRQKESWFREISDFWLGLGDTDPDAFIIAGERAKTVRMFMERMPAQEIIEALRITNDRLPLASETQKFFKYFCGVCWTKIKIEGSGSALLDGS